MSRAGRIFGGLVLVSIFLPAVYASDDTASSIEFSGYYKTFLANSRTLALFPPQQDYTVDLNRVRLTVRGDLGETTSFNVQYDNEVFLGDYLTTSQFLAQKNLPTDNYLNLRQTYLDTDSVFARHGLYRAFVNTRVSQVDLRIGRQRIAWGSGLFWSPVDIINPFDPTQIEREERRGVDAIVADWDYGDLSRLSLVYAAHAPPVRATTAARWRTNWAGFDTGITAGRFRDDDMAGFDFAGQWGPVGLRGEWTRTSSPLDGSYQRVVFSMDYTLPNTLSMIAELYYNGQGKTDPASYQFTRLFNGEIQSLAQRYLGAMVGYDFTPLWKWRNYYIRNLDDGSEFLYTRLVYSATENSEWSGGAQLFAGGTGTEYGTFENIALLQVQWFF